MKSRELLKKIIGIAGTAKNTGKTTTMTALMDRVYQERVKLGLTGIGYDGEAVDNVTGLPKPRIRCERDTIIATAERCLQAGSAGIEVMTLTKVRTALGRVIIGRVIEPGQVVLAGPIKGSELKMVNETLSEHGCRLILVDGALNRMAPMVETDGLILATGAARTSNIQELAGETRSLAKILSLPFWQRPGVPEVKTSSLLTEATVAELLRKVAPGDEAVFVDGVISENCFQMIAERGRDELAGKALVLPDPIKVMVAGNPQNVCRMLDELKSKDIHIFVRKRIKLIAVTVNPFYPRYRFVSRDYEPAYVDKDELKSELSAGCGVPVLNVVDDGVEKLWEHIG
ncbi:MAG: hypothetical protein QHH10_09650 [Peptococcaceae bacterium]|jgi:hypothetical protein|nr:hypothetical protein [Peptococcaceae bacterium]MDH7525563.1 hypothetical protein [Peptococcaceae bacterium]